MTIAVVIPVRDGAHLLGQCMGAISRQARPPDEVLITVALSVDGTKRVAEDLSGPGIRVIDNPEGDRASAINRALPLIHSDLVAMVDAQATLDPDYLDIAEQVLADPAIGVAGGPMRPCGASPVGRAMAAALRSPFGVGDSQFHFAGEARDVDSVYLGVYRRTAFEQVGGYNAALLRTEDDDLNARIREAGFRIRLDPRIRSTYRCRDTLPAIWRQYFGYGYWKVALAAIRRDAIRPRHLAPLAFLAACAIGTVIGLAGWWLPLLVVLAAWLAAATLAAVTAPADGIAARILFPVVALTMHLAYGTGTLLGLVALPRLRRLAMAGARTAEHPPQ